MKSFPLALILRFPLALILNLKLAYACMYIIFNNTLIKI